VVLLALGVDVDVDADGDADIAGDVDTSKERGDDLESKEDLC
jgi:hypothetical protein